MHYLGVVGKQIGNALPISAGVGKVKSAMNLGYIGKFSCIFLPMRLSTYENLSQSNGHST